MDSSVASELKKLKEDEKLELNVKVSKIMDLLQKHSLMQQMHLHCDQVLVHPQNRAGTTLVFGEVHRKGNMMLKAGVDLSKLDSCICFETAADAGQRSQQLQANMDLVAQSQGKLAPVTGAERYLSVSGSHTVSFCKSVLHCCGTEDPDLLKSCPNGHLSLDALLSNSSLAVESHPFTQMVKRGWAWKVIKQEVEVQFSDLPALIQQAQNSGHALASQITEMEAAMQIAFWYKQCKDLNQAVSMTLASQPMCAHYLDSIASKLMLGQEFMEHISNIDWKDKQTTFPWVRAGCIAANLTSPKAVDSIGRMIVKTDLDKLRQQGIRAELRSAEGLCDLAWSSLQKAGLASQNAGITLMGRYLVRTALLLCNKSSKGKEKHVYESMSDINSAFLAELAAMQSGSASSTAAASAPSNVAEDGLVALQACPRIKHRWFALSLKWRLCECQSKTAV